MIAAGLMAGKIIQGQSYFNFVCLVAAHCSSITTPLIYLTLDKRFRFKFKENLKGVYGPGATTNASP